MKKTKLRKFPGSFFTGKMLRTMKLTFLLIVLQTLQLNAKGYSQETITLKMHDATFEEVVKEIERQSQVTFLYNHAYVHELVHLNFNYKNIGLPEVLNRLLEGTSLEYKLMDNTVVITAKNSQEQSKSEVQEIKGKVVDKEGFPCLE